MKIHFLIPSTREFGKQEVLDRIYGCNYGFFPQHNVFILLPATILKNAGFEVEITDCVVEKISSDQALERGDDIFVLYSVFLSRETDLQVAKQIRKWIGLKWVIFLGNDPVWFINKYLIADNHIVVRGEPEVTLVELARELNKENPNLTKIPGISWCKKGKIIHNSSRSFINNLNQLPIPDRMLYKKPFFYPNARFSQFPSTTALFSRGCSYRCYYCLPNSLSYTRELEYKKVHKIKPPVRVRSAEKVIKELKLIAKQGFRSVSILDDQFLWDRPRTDKIFNGIKDLGLEIAILARCDRITDLKLAKDMYRAGIKHIAFGVESFNQEILDYIKKDLRVETIRKGIDYCKKARIEPELNILIGSCPLETKKTIAETLKEVEKLNIDIVHINIMTPFPGTEFAKLAKEKGWLTVPEYTPIDSSAQSLISYPHLTDKELVRTIKKFIFRHYFSPGYLLRKISKIHSFGDLASKIKAGLNEFRLLFIK